MYTRDNRIDSDDVDAVFLQIAKPASFAYCLPLQIGDGSNIQCFSNSPSIILKCGNLQEPTDELRGTTVERFFFVCSLAGFLDCFAGQDLLKGVVAQSFHGFNN